MADGSVLIDRDSGNCFELNRIGETVWMRLAAGEPINAIISALSTEYGVPAGTVEADVGRLVQDLMAHGLLVDA